MSKEVMTADTEPIHEWFGLTYANYLVLPRSVLQSMPIEWQERFVACLDEMHERYEKLPWSDYEVRAKENNRYIKDPIPHYNRGRTRIPSTQDGRTTVTR